MDNETHMRIRVPDTLRDRLIALADKNQRSLNAEVVARLEASLTHADDVSELKKLVADIQEQQHFIDTMLGHIEFSISDLYSRTEGLAPAPPPGLEDVEIVTGVMPRIPPAMLERKRRERKD